jgi:site-specific recombinase XerD
MPDMVLKKVIRAALMRAGIKDKVIGWHSSRHSFATNFCGLGVDVKVLKSCFGMPTVAQPWTFTRRPSPQTSGQQAFGNWSS